jgi:CheY-like chemotaxis protein
MDAIQATDFIRKEFNDKIVIIAITAYSFPDNSYKFKESGFNDCLTKPLNSMDLKEMILKYTAVK